MSEHGSDHPIGEVHEAGEGVSDQEMIEQVGEQTSSDLKYADVFKREADGTSTDVEAAKASADELAGE
jgi:UDP-glucose 4-epimerase